VKIIYQFLLALIMPVCCQSQNFGAYTDIQLRFFGVENGVSNNLEPLPPREFKVGKTGIAYLDNIGIFKVYRGGVKNKLNDIFTTDFGVTDNYIYYKTQNSLNVVDGNEEVMLCRLVGDYAVGDSSILYYDRVRNILFAYSNHKSVELENNLATPPYSSFKVSDNIIAYQNFMDQFKVYANEESFILESIAIRDYEVGRNTVAYVDNNNNFKIWQNGEVKHSEAFPPKRYMVGDNVVAFVSYDGNFKIFHDEKIETIGFFDQKFMVKDFLVGYEDGNGYFKIFHNGKSITVDNYFPSDVIMQYNSMAYIDKNNTLRLFQNNAIHNITNLVKSLEDVSLNYDVMQYKIGANMFRFFYDGKVQ
jgi:hypothetical protein